MIWQPTPMALPYFISAFIAALATLYVWRLKPEHGQAWLAGMAFAGLWAFGNGLEMITPTLSGKLWIIRYVLYLGVLGTVSSWGWFTIRYSNYEYWLNRYAFFLLAIIPALIYTLIITLTHHSLIFKSYELQEVHGLALLHVKEYGLVFKFWTAYSYLIILAGSGLLIYSVLHSPKLYQGQAVVLISGVLIPTFFNIFYWLGFRPFGTADISSITVIASFALLAYGMMRFRVLDVVPVAHHLIFESVQIGVIILDNHLRVIDMNPTAEAIFGRSKNSIISQNVFEAFPEYGHLMRRFEHLQEIKTQITIEPKVYEIQIRPLQDPRGTTAGRIALLYDVTEREHALAERDKLIGELDAYAHTVAHDLKNPLAAVIGFTDLILGDFQADYFPDDVREYLGFITRYGHKMNSIIDELLTLASVRNMEEIEIAPLDMAKIVDSALERLHRATETSQVKMIRPLSWPTALGYAPWVEEVWANYLSNALKYGGKPPIITLGADTVMGDEGPVARFWVHDNGQGLTAVEASRLFEEFSRLHQHANVKGHGLGLSIVQRIITKLGGTVGVESEPGHGSRFYFTLPITQPTAVAETDTPLPHNAYQATPTT